MFAHCRMVGFREKERNAHCLATTINMISYFGVYYLHMLFARTSHVLCYGDDIIEGGCQIQTVTRHASLL